VGKASEEDVYDDRYWKKDGWIARVIKNEDDEGWAVEMTRVGDDEPALVGPWTMGRDKKNPKPLDASAFATLTKTAREVLLRHEQAEHARLHKSRTITDDQGKRVRVRLDIIQDEDDPHGMLSAYDESTGEELTSQRVQANFALTETSAQRFLRSQGEL